MPKVCIVNGSEEYRQMFQSEGWEIVYCIDDADLVQFTGGSDVSPNLYGEERHPRTNNSVLRDREETILYKYCIKHNKPMAGICRGGQFLHVMNGGDLWQHVDNHAIYGTHNAFSPDGNVMLQVTSTHHQMMRMNDSGGEVLLIADECKQPKEHMIDNIINYVALVDDIECVYHKHSKSLCFQPHPEFDSGMQARDFYFRKISKLFGLKGDV